MEVDTLRKASIAKELSVGKGVIELTKLGCFFVSICRAFCWLRAMCPKNPD